jgi:sulfite exporter TauE/SafE
MDADRHGNDIKALLIRGGLLVSGITHFFLALWAGYTVFGMVTGKGTGGSGASSSSQSVSSWLLSQPFGRWLLIIVGLSMIGAGIAHVAKGAGEKFEKWFDWDAQKSRILSPVCCFGLYARSVIFFIIGIFFIYAGWTYDSGQTGGIPEALGWLQRQPFGRWLFLIVSAGLIAFGIYSLVESIYRRISVSK